MFTRKAKAPAPVLWLLGAVAVVPSIAAQEYKAKSSSVPAPTKVEVRLPTRGLPPQDPRAELEEREKRLQEHHRSGPLFQSRQTRAVAPRPVRVPPTAVIDPTAAKTIHLDSNAPLPRTAIRNMSSFVSEPSVAIRGKEILYTGNWYSAFSADAGATFTYLNPATTLPTIPDRPWCCDQLALYDARHDLMIWFVQYGTDATGDTERLAVAQGSDIASQQWRFYDFTPQNVGGWNNEWLDFPDLVLSEKYLYLTNNAFTTQTSEFKRSVIMRIPLDKLQAYQGFNYDYYDSEEDFTLRATHGATGTMYFADHPNKNILRVFSWPEDSNTISGETVPIETWVNEARSAPGPDKLDWLGRADPRITAGWLSGNTIGFAWTSAPDSKYPFQHVRVAILNKNSKAVVAQPHIWSPDFAFAYPAAATNADGRVGLSVFYGGGTHFPSHAVGVLDATNSSWELVTTASGTNGPASNRWGDYLTVRRDETNPKTWLATGYTLQGGTATTNVEPRLIRFSLAPPLGIKITLLNEKTGLPLPPGYNLQRNERAIIRATVTGRGIAVPGKKVAFRTANPGLLNPESSTVVTNSQGIAETKVRCEASGQATAAVTAEAEGIAETTTIPVRGRSLSRFLVLLGVLLFVSFLVLLAVASRKRSAPA
jgi:hypothetical protein